MVTWKGSRRASRTAGWRAARRAARWFSQPRRGFTLLEVLVVLLLIGVLGGLVAPNLFSALARSPVERSADGVASALREARVKAVRSGRTKRVVLEASEGRASPARGSREGGEAEAAVPVREEAGVVTAAALEPGVEARRLGATDVVFYPSGLSTGGGWRLRGGDGDSAMVLVDPLDGAIEVRR